jgi:hypothetical protein
VLVLQLEEEEDEAATADDVDCNDPVVVMMIGGETLPVVTLSDEAG